jgi:hypothetical protein
MYRLYVPVKFGKDIYAVRILFENNKNDDKGKIVVGNVYDVILEKEKTQVGEQTRTLKTPPATISIGQMLQNVKDYYGVNYLLQDNLFVNTEKATNKIVRGFITGKKQITLFSI